MLTSIFHVVKLFPWINLTALDHTVTLVLASENFELFDDMHVKEVASYSLSTKKNILSNIGFLSR